MINITSSNTFSSRPTSWTDLTEPISYDFLFNL